MFVGWLLLEITYCREPEDNTTITAIWRVRACPDLGSSRA
jgi:hypothetical protein